MKKLISFLGLKFFVTQYQWGRKFYGGTWHLIFNWLPMMPLWSNKLITSCGGRTLETENYERTI